MSRHMPAKCDKACTSLRGPGSKRAVVNMGRLRQLDLPEYTVKVQIDESKCVGPFDCGACLKKCPATVFSTYSKNRVKGEICNDWGIEANRDVFCWGCGVCIKVCPENAITIRELNK